MQEALEKSNADNQAAVAAAVLAAKQVLSADLVQQHKAELARQAQKAVDDMAAERLAWERQHFPGGVSCKNSVTQTSPTWEYVLLILNN
eukprot:1151980-Pelagomonas_calceolata.AAC.5